MGISLDIPLDAPCPTGNTELSVMLRPPIPSSQLASSWKCSWDQNRAGQSPGNHSVREMWAGLGDGEFVDSGELGVIWENPCWVGLELLVLKPV